MDYNWERRIQQEGGTHNSITKKKRIEQHSRYHPETKRIEHTADITQGTKSMDIHPYGARMEGRNLHWVAHIWQLTSIITQSRQKSTKDFRLCYTYNITNNIYLITILTQTYSIDLGNIRYIQTNPLTDITYAKIKMKRRLGCKHYSYTNILYI